MQAQFNLKTLLHDQQHVILKIEILFTLLPMQKGKVQGRGKGQHY